jgi:hypothetical protein
MKDILMLAVNFDWDAACPHHNQQLIACSSSYQLGLVLIDLILFAKKSLKLYLVELVSR